MTSRSTIVIAAFGVAMGTTALVPTPIERATAPAFDQAVETHRVQLHFDSVVAELSARDTRALTPSARTHRTRAIRRLADYRHEARFPHNYDIPGIAPTFVDPHTNAYCAVADLLRTTGRDDIVQRVATADNHVYVDDLRADTALAGWLTENGLTLEEAARIQVPYVAYSEPEPAARQVNKANQALALAGMSTLSATWNLLGNSDGHRRIGNIFGIASGATAVVFGARSLDGGSARGVTLASMGVGTFAAALATRGVMNRLYNDRLMRDRVTVTPTIEPTKGASNGATTASVGLSAQIRF